MKILVFDTETTGLPLFREPSEDPRQPNIVQVAAILFDDLASGPVVLGQMNRIVRPNGWEWTENDKAFKAHGITVERAMDEGVSEAEALEEFHALQLQCDMRVAHNVAFDDRILHIAYKRYGDGSHAYDSELGNTERFLRYTQEEKDAIADAYKERPSFCTMNATKNVLKLPTTEKQVRAGFCKGFKPPKLTEAFNHYFGFVFDGAHDAMNDVKACADVYFAIQDGILEPIYTVKS